MKKEKLSYQISSLFGENFLLWESFNNQTESSCMLLTDWWKAILIVLSLWFFEKKIFEGKTIRLVFFFFHFYSFSWEVCSDKRWMLNNFAELLQLLIHFEWYFRIIQNEWNIIFPTLQYHFVGKYPILFLDIVLVQIVTHSTSKIR